MKALDALGGIAAALVFAAAGALLLGAGGPAQVEPAGIEQLQAIAPPASTRSCKGCGWIESRREDQYTVRMADGTSRVFDEVPGVRWRLGERLNYID